MTGPPPLELTRDQVLAHRWRVLSLDARLPLRPASLERAAWSGLQDSMPRAALLSIHARVAGARPDTWERPPLVQVWGPRFSAFVIAERDLGIFTIGRLPDDDAGLRRAIRTADALEAFLDGRRMSASEAAHGLGIGNSIRYAAPTGRFLIRWDGARQPVIWSVPAPRIDPAAAQDLLVRRYLHVFGPGTAQGFGDWAGIRTPRATRIFDGLGDAGLRVRTRAAHGPFEGWILAEDEASFRAPVMAMAAVRLLPSGDAAFLAWRTDRALLVPDGARRPQLWTPRVWPGAVFIGGEIAGVWRRPASATVVVEPWRPLTPAERETVIEEAESLPLPDLRTGIRTTFVD